MSIIPKELKYHIDQMGYKKFLDVPISLRNEIPKKVVDEMMQNIANELGARAISLYGASENGRGQFIGNYAMDLGDALSLYESVQTGVIQAFDPGTLESLLAAKHAQKDELNNSEKLN
jgi:hypothetical protein